MKKALLKILFLLAGSCIWTACSDDTPDQTPETTTISNEIYYANKLGKDILSTYYYWNKNINDDLEAWNIETNEDPIETVDKIRYHEGDKYIDKWTMMTDDMDSFTSSVGGVSTTFGWNLTVYLVSDDNQCIGVINYVSAGSPAEKAGLKRGDILLWINGQNITTDNYQELYYASSLTVALAEIDWESNSIIASGKEVELTATTLYENPILCDTVYEFNGKKVGYLAYASFDLIAIPELVEIGKKFKSENISELILDLRYNGGGYVITENVLASMFAPQADVEAKKIFEKETYNDYLTEIYRQEGISLETRFTTEYNYDDINLHISTKDANIGLKKIYGIISSGTASASEALLSGLMPYMDIELIGTASHGKYCTGLMLSGEDTYQRCPEEIKNWGVYIMVSIYQNANGETPCMPDGLQPDVTVEDNPMLPYQLGDVNEPLLQAALLRAGRKYENLSTRSHSQLPLYPSLPMPQKATFGKRILLPPAAIKHSDTIMPDIQ